VGYSQQSTAPGHLSSHDSTYTLRGNITTATRLINISPATSISQSARYDVFGNRVQLQLDCCTQTSFTFNQDTYWSQPDQATDGNSGGPTLTNNASYNFNTSGMASSTDPNGLTTNYGYNSWLEPTQVNPPAGDSLGFGYDDWGGQASRSVSYTDGGVNKVFSTSVAKDGWGNSTQQVDAAGNKVNLSYDNMGRQQSVTNPFAPNGAPGPATTYQYDVLGRITKVTSPDGNSTQWAYSGNTTTVTDQVGRKIQRQADALGRLATVTEQDPATGALSVVTSYSYDYLDNLIQISQGGQTRNWKHDAIGRMLYERIPEQSAAINDGTGTMWSCKYTYTNFGAIATKTDARAVVVTYGYDALNRPASASYDVSHATGVASTPSVVYNYDTSTTSSTKGYCFL
jgi:YD repeat-containing protein